MIEIKEANSPIEYKLIVDGVSVDNEDIKIYKSTGDSFSLTITDSELNQKILAHRFSDIPDYIWNLEIFVEPYLVESLDIHEEINIFHRSPLDPFEIRFAFDLQFNIWKHLWSVEDYVNEVFNIYEQNEYPGLDLPKLDEYTITEFSFYAFAKDSENTIEEGISEYAEIIREVLRRTEMSLMSKLRNESVVMYFDFPENVRISCEQYLVYFVQFLKDLGVEATAELQHEAGQVLFAVTPTNEKDALDKIRTALEAYLSLPASKLTNEDKDIVMQRLAGNIYHLKSQLALSQAMLQTKDATIEAQQLTISTQKLLLSGDIFLESLKDVTPKPKDKEELLGGTVAIKKYDGKFVEVDLPELYRKLKRLFENKD